MKKYYFLFSILITLFLFQNCQPLTYMYIETAEPAKIDFPGNFNKIVFINLENDLNDDGEIDTLLYNIITEEMALGFMHSTKNSLGIDSTRFLYLRTIPKMEEIYIDDTISWYYLDRISKKTNADIFILLDSLKFSMHEESYNDHNTYPAEYYKYRQFSIHAYWSVYDLIMRTRLDQHHYADTMFWEAIAYSEVEAKEKLQSVERSIRETSYFTATDYANRIFPGWNREIRYYFVKGNKDFERAADLVKKGEWDQASEIWKPYVNHIDKEIASRAAYNLALANELDGRFIKAIGWAERSNQIKWKSRTTRYINRLKERQEQLEKIQEQVY